GVERVVWAPLTGPGSLTDPSHQQRRELRAFGVGPAFDLPGDAFGWGFTASILEPALVGLGLDAVSPTAPVREIPPERRRCAVPAVTSRRPALHAGGRAR